MFGCGYDDLRQRHRERRLKRIAAITAAAVFVFGAVSAMMAMRIQSQSRQIENQHLKIEEQYTEAPKTNAVTQSAKALRILERGDRLPAVKTALAVLTGPQTPTPQAQYALAQSLGAYEDGTRVLPKYTLHHDTAVDFMTVSPDGTRLLTADGYGKLYVWDAPNETLLYETEELIKINLSEETAGFLDDDRIYYPTAAGLGIDDLSKKSSAGKALPASFFCAAICKDGSRYALLDSDAVTVYNAVTGRPLCVCSLLEEHNRKYALTPDERGETLAVMWEIRDEDGPDRAFVSVWDVQSNTITAEYPPDTQSLRQFDFFNRTLPAAANQLNGANSNGALYCWDTKESQLLWRQNCGIADSFVFCAANEKPCILTALYDTASLLR